MTMGESLDFVAYDTLCRLQINRGHMKNADESRTLLAGVRELALQVQATLSMYDEHSELATLCRTYLPGAPHYVSPMLGSFLEQNLEICRLSNGALDPTVGPLVKLWGFGGTAKVPSGAELAAARERVGWQRLHLDATGHTLTLDAPGMVIDPGASGKGFALGLAVAHLLDGNVTGGVADFGGNLYVIGPKEYDADGTSIPWRVAIRDPDDHDSIIGTVAMQNLGISTSSWYEHCFTEGGVTYHHLLDPRTGRPMPLDVKSVSIISSKAIYTDLLSTAFFVLGAQKGAALIDTVRAQSGSTVEYVAVLADGSVVHSPGAQFTPAK